MLSPSEYDHLCDQLMTLYDELDQAIINDMVRRMMRMGKATDATAWQVKQLQESGLLYDDILSEIASRTDATEAQVRSLFEDAGIQSVRNDNRYYKAGGLEGIVRLSDAALQTLNAGYVKCNGNLKNLTLTTANTAQEAYLRACDLAYMEVSTGTMDYGTAIRRAVESAASEGAWVLYPSGHRDRLDVAVRRSALTGVGQTVRQLSVINANDMGCDLMEITAHAGARPTHAEWQGQLVSLSGKNAGRKIDGARVYSLKEIGYGTGDGFGGWNCRHDWFPFFEGISSRAYSDERLKELNARNIEYDGKMYTEYEIDQMQRALERDIREKKRKVSAADTAVKNAPDEVTAKQMSDMFTKESVKLKKAEKKLSDFLGQTGNLPDSTRVWVNGFGRSTAQKAVWANRRTELMKDLTSKDFNDIIPLKGKLSSADVRKWYVAHDKKIPELIDRSKSIEEQARQACELRNTFRTQARDLMEDQAARSVLDKTDPNQSFEELVKGKMERKNMSYDEAVADVLETATKTRKSVNKKFGLE
ncbi:MAG: phage minor capsid protein [Ruminococcus sp.]|nr:phage minor capsid protein [Ruminococcus sp.]